METNGNCSLWSTKPIQLLNIPMCWRLGAKGISCCCRKGAFGCNVMTIYLCVTSAAFIYKTQWALSLLFLCLWHLGISTMLVTHKHKIKDSPCHQQLMPSPMRWVSQPLCGSCPSIGERRTSGFPKLTEKPGMFCFLVLISHWTAVCLAHALPVLSTDNLVFLLCVQLPSPILEACSREKEVLWFPVPRSSWKQGGWGASFAS